MPMRRGTDCEKKLGLKEYKNVQTAGECGLGLGFMPLI